MLMPFGFLFLAKHHKRSGFPDVPSARPDIFCCSGRSGISVFLPIFQLVHPIWVCQKLAAHGGALDMSIEKLLLHKIRVVQAAHPANGEIGILTHFVAELEETTGMTKVRVVCRRNRIFQRRMVRQGHMEAGYACPFQQWHENRQFFFYKVTKLKLFL